MSLTSTRIIALVAMLFALGGCVSSLLKVNQWASTLDWNGRESIELPLTLDARGRPTVTAHVSGKEVLALIDTGSPVTTISDSAADRLKLKIITRKTARRLDEGLKVQLGASSMDFHMVPVGQGTGLPQLILGQEIFSKAVVEMDFESRRLVINHPDTFSAPSAPAIKVERTYTRPNIQVQLASAKRPICATIDTGFDSGLALPSKLVKELALPADPRGRRVVYSGFSRQRVEVEALEPLETLTFGDQSTRDVPVVGAVPDEAAKCNALLGMAVLSRYRLIFDMRNDRMWFLPRESSLLSGHTVHEPREAWDE